MSSLPTIRIANLGDLASLLPLFRAYQSHYGQLTNASEEQTKTFLAEHLANSQAGFVLLACEDVTAVGFATVYFTVSGLIAQRLAHLGDLYVSPEYRKRGIGTALFDGVTREARARSIQWVRWLSLSSNKELNHWYNRIGRASGPFELYFRPTEEKPQ